MTPCAVGRRAQQVLDVELGLAEEDVGAFLLEHDDRAQQHAHRRRRHPAVLLEERLALVRVQELERRARSFRSSSGRSLSSQYLKISDRIDVCVSLRSSTLPSSSGPNELTVARTWRAALAAQRQELDRVAGRLEGQPERGHPLLDLGVASRRRARPGRSGRP